MERFIFYTSCQCSGEVSQAVPALTLFFSKVYNELKTEKALAKPDGCANDLCT